MAFDLTSMHDCVIPYMLGLLYTILSYHAYSSFVVYLVHTCLSLSSKNQKAGSPTAKSSNTTDHGSHTGQSSRPPTTDHGSHTGQSSRPPTTDHGSHTGQSSRHPTTDHGSHTGQSSRPPTIDHRSHTWQSSRPPTIDHGSHIGQSFRPPISYKTISKSHFQV